MAVEEALRLHSIAHVANKHGSAELLAYTMDVPDITSLSSRESRSPSPSTIGGTRDNSPHPTVIARDPQATPRGRPVSFSSTFWPNTSVASNISCQTVSSTSKPKHVAIIIPDSAYHSIGASVPDTPISLSGEPLTLQTTLLGLRRGSDPEVGLQRPKHIPIQIPLYAQPYGLVPENQSSRTSAIYNLPPHSLSNRRTSIMSRPPTRSGRTSAMDSTASRSPTQLYKGQFKQGSSTYLADMNSSQSSLAGQSSIDSVSEKTPGPSMANQDGPNPPQRSSPSKGQQPSSNSGTPNSSSSLSGLVCNVHRTTGKEPRPLVGASTTVLGDKLYVFGGRVISRSKPQPQLTADLYELDLIRRHWTKLETKGDVPPPRYFHSVCALGDTKLVCYGGMTPAMSTPGHATSPQQATSTADPPSEFLVLSDIYILDVPSLTWSFIPTTNAPQGRYAHCATITPSSAAFSSATAPLSAIHHNPPSSNPNQGSLGVALDGTGGAEMVVVGGQDNENHYIEQISVFNLRSLKWTSTERLARSCGAYRSVVCPLPNLDATRLGKVSRNRTASQDIDDRSEEGQTNASTLIYSNYNFLDKKLELQVRYPDGTLAEKQMQGEFSPPGLRFPNGGIIANHFILSGTYLTSYKQEYTLWALDLKKLTWTRVDAGGGLLGTGSWNRGVVWQRQNSFVLLGNRKRSLYDDYGQRRLNFSNICVVELEAFGFYENPRRVSPASGYISASSPYCVPSLPPPKVGYAVGGRPLSKVAEDLGQMALNCKELADMEFLAVGGERIPVNSRVISRRWGPYFVQLLREDATVGDNTDVATLRPGAPSAASRNSSITITPSVRTAFSGSTTAVGSSASTLTSNSASNQPSNPLDPPDPRTLSPTSRLRTLYMPHTALTLQSLLHYLYTGALPYPLSPLCTPQILCSLLQLARPYHIDGLLEATVERLHQVLDGRNTAAVFNAAAMAAGGGRGVSFLGTYDPYAATLSEKSLASQGLTHDLAGGQIHKSLALRIDTKVRSKGRAPMSADDTDDDLDSAVSSATGTSASASNSEWGSHSDLAGLSRDREIWSGELSSVVGLQKRGLRGLMEGRRMRERGREPGPVAAGGPSGVRADGSTVGLGIQ